MLQYIYYITVLAYGIICFFTYCEYKRNFMFDNKISTKKVLYLTAVVLLNAVCLVFMGIFGYLIFTM